MRRERTMYDGKCLQNDILHTQMWTWEVRINTGVATEGHLNTENGEEKKNARSGASLVPRVIFHWSPSDLLMRRVRKNVNR